MDTTPASPPPHDFEFAVILGGPCCGYKVWLPPGMTTIPACYGAYCKDQRGEQWTRVHIPGQLTLRTWQFGGAVWRVFAPVTTSDSDMFQRLIQGVELLRNPNP